MQWQIQPLQKVTNTHPDTHQSIARMPAIPALGLQALATIQFAATTVGSSVRPRGWPSPQPTEMLKLAHCMDHGNTIRHVSLHPRLSFQRCGDSSIPTYCILVAIGQTCRSLNEPYSHGLEQRYETQGTNVISASDPTASSTAGSTKPA